MSTSPPAPAPDADARQAARELLCIRCRRGERAAWEELVSLWERPLFYYVRRMTRSEEDALGVLQEMWLQVFSSLPTIADPARLAPWLYTLARRAVLRRIGELGTDRTDPAELSDEVDPRADFTDALDDAEAIHWGLEQLAPLGREVLVLFFLEDLSLREIAEVLDIPVGTVKSRLSKARGDLRALLDLKEPRRQGTTT